MGNTPSAQLDSPAKANGGRAHSSSQSQSSTNATSSSSRNPNLRLPMPQRPIHVSPKSSNPTSPSGGRPSSPRRRKSLELPDLNRLSFTPAAPVPTTATHTSHHLAPSTSAAGHAKIASASAIPMPSIAPSGPIPTEKWRQALGGRASPLMGVNALGTMSKLDSSVPAPKTAPISMQHASVSPQRVQEGSVNPYFPVHPPAVSPIKVREASPRGAEPIPIPTKIESPVEAARKVAHTDLVPGLETSQPTMTPSPSSQDDQEDNDQPNDGLVNVPVQWTGGGKVVYVTGNFAENWKGRIKLKRSTHDFNAVLRLPPGQYRLKFIVDDSWRCSKQISTATDDDGTLVNWIEVEAPKTEEELKVEWATGASPDTKPEDLADETRWTNLIPAPLTLYQYLEELPHTFTQEQLQSYYQTAPYLSTVPQPPILPRILDKVIVNSELRSGLGSVPPTGLDDNSILAVPNHVVLNHLTASAIKNGTLGVGTTTRYRKKYITTMFFKPTLGDLMGDTTPAPPGTHTVSTTTQ